MSAERQAVVRNMSAPPRTTLTFASLVPSAGATGDAIADGAGLTHVCRLDLGDLLPKRCSTNMYVDQTWQAGKPEDLVRAAYPYALAEREGRNRPGRAAYSHAKATPIETLVDELREVAASVSLRDEGLPPFGLFMTCYGVRRTSEESLCKTIAILARRRGELFLRDSDPVIWPVMSAKPLDLWMPAPGRRGRP